MRERDCDSEKENKEIEKININQWSLNKYARERK